VTHLLENDVYFFRVLLTLVLLLNLTLPGQSLMCHGAVS
jgi:hypothetical protein